MQDQIATRSQGRMGVTQPGVPGLAAERPGPRVAGRADLRGWLLILCIAVLGFAFLGARGLWEPDEGRYSAVALNMLESGDYLVPRLNPSNPHFAKPPLTYWAVAASVATFGHSEFAVRLPAALAYALTALVVALIASTIGLRRPMMAAAIWSTTLLPFVASSVITPDMLLTLFESMAVLGYLHWRGRRSSGALWLMWLCFGAAFMTKGPPALLPLLAILAFEATRGRAGRVGALVGSAPVIVFLALASWWFVYVAVREPSLWRYFLVDETVNRVATAAHDRNPGWAGLLRVYGPTLLVGTLPFSPVLAWALLRRRQFAAAAAVPFLYFWMAIPLAVFALAQSRLPLYLLPSTVPFALAVAARADAAGVATRTIRNLALASACLLIGLRFAAAGWPSDNDSRALAADLAAGESLHRFDGILFIDRDRPAYGLEFYTARKIDGVSLDARARAHSQPLCARLERNDAPLFLVPIARVDAFTRAAAGCGVPLAALAPTRRFAQFAKAAPPAPKTGSDTTRP